MILIIIPVKNEVKTIRQTAKDIEKWCKDNLGSHKIVFIDDNSTDKTIEELIYAKIDNVSIIRNRFDWGKGSALKAGYIISTATYKLKNNDTVIFMDGDGQIVPDNIKSMMKIMDLYQADLVIGNKNHDYSITKYPLKRKIVSFVYNIIVRVLFGFKYRDTQCGIKAFKKSAFDRVVDKINTKRFAFDLEIVVASREMGFRVADSPVTIKEQMNNGSVKLGTILQTFIDTIVIWLKKKKGLYR